MHPSPEAPSSHDVADGISDLAANLAAPVPQALCKSATLPALGQPSILHRLPTPARAQGAAASKANSISQRGAAASARCAPVSVPPASSRRSPTENQSTIPHVASPMASSTKIAGSARGIGGGGTAAFPTARQTKERSPGPLVDLTHVLNWITSKPQAEELGEKGEPLQPNYLDQHYPGEFEQKASSVAAELLISSALRMQWPGHGQRVGLKDAASSCRDAASVLSEAATQLLGTAALLESSLPSTGGGAAGQVRDNLPKSGACDAKSKRRRTFGGGPSPTLTRAPSPPKIAAPLVAPRGSPPVRFASFSGLRV